MKNPIYVQFSKAGNSILRAELVVRFVFLVETGLKIDSFRNQQQYRTIRRKTFAAKRKAMHLIATFEFNLWVSQDDTYNMDETGFRVG